MLFLQDNSKDAWFTFTEKEGKQFQEDEQNVYPRMLVSIGSGVSIIKVNSLNSFQRVAGTMIGGGTLVGLSNLLLQVNNFDEISDLSRKGDNSTVDTLIKDLYGSSYDGLEGDTIASSFGKVSNLSYLYVIKSFFL